MSRRSTPILAMIVSMLIMTVITALPGVVIGQSPVPEDSPTPTTTSGPTQTGGELDSLPVEDQIDLSNDTINELREKLTLAVRDALATLPEPITLQQLDFDGHVLSIDLGETARTFLDTGRFSELMEPINAAVNTVLEQENLSEQRSLDYQLLIMGEPLAAQEDPVVENDQGADLTAINSQRIVINPGHGWYNDGRWRLQRGYWFDIVEDFINADLAIELRNKLAAVGADVRSTRELNPNAGTHAASGKPLWQVGAAAYTQHIGAPTSVWNTGSNSLNRDIMARPLYANWVGANAMISIHNNGGRGCGTETWYDTSNGYATQSYDLAQRIQSKIIERVRQQWNSNWCNRGVKGSNGGYAEIRALSRPAVLIELGFMDTETDNRALQSPTFRSIVTQAISDAVSDYFGGVAVNCPDGTYRAEYFANAALSGTPTFVRCDSAINNAWGWGGPGGGLSPDNFSVRWSGRIYFPAGTYAFIATADDGVRVHVDGYPLIDGWRDQAPTQYRGTRGLSAGYHQVKMEYYEHGGTALAQLAWNTNLAQHSPTFATSQENASSLYPALGNDGSVNTRWSSRQSVALGDQWWWTKIGSRQTITQVRIRWENAYAADHCIAWWSDGDSLSTIKCYTISRPGYYTYNIGSPSAQYVGVLMRRRARWMLNYSFWEFEVYRFGGTLSEQEDGTEILLAEEQAVSEDIAVPTITQQYQVYLPQLMR